VTRAIILLAVLFVGCDVDTVLATAVQSVLEEPPSKPRIVCRDGAVARPLNAGMALAVACEPVDAGRAWR
jgi:hypothetical protein